jgi:hypothetical protein
MNTKICKACNKELEITEFYKQYHKSKGKTYYSSYCKPCDREKSKQIKDSPEYKSKQNEKRRLKLKTDPKHREKVNAQKRKSYRNNPAKTLLNRAKARASRKGYEFNLELEDITIPETCPLLGYKLEMGSKNDYSHSPSLDRIDPTKGYIKGNVWVISTKANTIKSNLLLSELKEVISRLDDIVRTIGNNNL